MQLGSVPAAMTPGNSPSVDLIGCHCRVQAFRTTSGWVPHANAHSHRWMDEDDTTFQVFSIYIAVYCYHQHPPLSWSSLISAHCGEPLCPARYDLLLASLIKLPSSRPSTPASFSLNPQHSPLSLSNVFHRSKWQRKINLRNRRMPSPSWVCYAPPTPR